LTRANIKSFTENVSNVEPKQTYKYRKIKSKYNQQLNVTTACITQHGTQQ